MSKRMTDKDMFQYFLSQYFDLKKKYDAVNSRISADTVSLGYDTQIALRRQYESVSLDYRAFCRAFTEFVAEHADKIKFE